MAGAMLSFGGLLSEVLQGGATGLTQSNPSIIKVLGGFVFPVGLVMFGLSVQSPAWILTPAFQGLYYKDKNC